MVLCVFLFMGLGPKFLDNKSQPSLNRLPRNLHKSVVVSSLKHTIENYLNHPLKIWQGKNVKFRRVPLIGSA